jgi:hypothetical protein
LNGEKHKLDLEAKARVQDRGQQAYPKGNKFVDNDELPPEEDEVLAPPAIQDVAEGDDDGNMDSSNLSLGQEGDEDADGAGHHDDDNKGGAPLDLAEADADLPGRKEHVAAGSSKHDSEAGADSNTAPMGDKVSGSNDAPVPGAKQHIDPKVAAVFEKATSEIAAMRKVFHMPMCDGFASQTQCCLWVPVLGNGGIVLAVPRRRGRQGVKEKRDGIFAAPSSTARRRGGACRDKRRA